MMMSNYPVLQRPCHNCGKECSYDYCSYYYHKTKHDKEVKGFTTSIQETAHRYYCSLECLATCESKNPVDEYISIHGNLTTELLKKLNEI